MGIDEINIEADGFITREQDITPLEKVTDNTARPTEECLYPLCEKCSKYIGMGAVRYCTVPMVINKQVWTMTTNTIAELRKRVDDLTNDLVTLALATFSEQGKKNEDDERELYDKTIVELVEE